MADSKIIVFAVVGLLIGVAAGAGIGFAVFHKDTNDDQTYYFYLDFGTGNEKSKWYSASAADADAALEKAMKGTDIPMSYSKWGYPNFTETGSWATYNYMWSTFTKKAADASITGEVDDAYGMQKSNGWNQYAGFNQTEDGTDHKLCESGSTVFYFSPYSALRNPVENTEWMAAAGTPFATA